MPLERGTQLGFKMVKLGQLRRIDRRKKSSKNDRDGAIIHRLESANS